MSSTIKVFYSRSDKWRQETAIATGQSVPGTGQAEVSPDQLTEEARRLICKGGMYEDMRGFALYSSGRVEATHFGWTCGSGIAIDSLDPTRSQISAAIVAAYNACIAQREANAKEAADKEAADKAKAEEWASLPLAWRANAEGVCHCRPFEDRSYRGPLSASGYVQYDKGKLGQYVPVAYQEALAEHNRLKHIAERAEMRDEIKALKEKLGTLSEFLSVIPQDALRGALRAMVKVSDFDGELRERIEDAATCHIFDEDEAEVE